MDTQARLNAALAYRPQHPTMSISAVAREKKVAKSTLAARINGTHAPRGTKSNRNLSVVEEGVIIGKINQYAARGTLLQPRHIRQLAEGICGHQVGENWTSTFLRRHKDEVSSKYYGIQESARVKADTPEHRRAFYHQVSASTAHFHAQMVEITD
jgi:hypothetical protein